jgi:2-(1,2-epoxy-1,2-dihydrophenyl)acetyl-CoA isomerase
MTTATEEPLLADKAGGVLVLTLNRPKVLNALTLAMLEDLNKRLKEAERDPEVRCVVLKAAGRAFTAGADLGDLKARQEKSAFSLGDELRRHFNPLILQLRRMEKPVVASVQGLAAGAGASLALACDLKLCAEEASFILAFVKVGLVPDSGLSWTLPRHLGLAKALEHAWTAKPLAAADALAAGLVNSVVPAYRLEAAVLEVAGKLVSAPPRAVALTKRQMNRALEQGFEAQLEYEAQLQEILGRTRDHAEGVQAFLEKRPARFTGE